MLTFKLILLVSVFAGLFGGNLTHAEELEVQLEEEVGPEDALEREEMMEDEEEIPFYSEWHEKMGGFHPKSLLSMNVPPKSTELFYENVKKAPTTIRGTFYTLSKEEYLTVEFSVKSPSGQVLYTTVGSEGIFSVEATMPGIYELALSNTNWVTSVAVTLAVGTDDHSVLQSKHIANTSNRIKSLEENIDSIYSQFRYLWLHNHRQMNATKLAEKHLLMYAIGQFVIIFVCSITSVWYVKRIVSNKRIL
ncbi:uncharacterized protein BEWA_031180 [Theileria equi strain WA]|uniref:Membrane protein, putative n=1 Tax=Theileria equi strain WA TaxID=1537102 RepID=L0AXH0_THEEQ|nr:uncharacterized protein BEWA_031180 [Theileria equi strain WA]AFZ80265.1 membrane protein, putative [Theileria equi strain WA]|eukprot:XP_004829931.1 uncharacterized protein BEWA_031180 [Theileria equi strain WA]